MAQTDRPATPIHELPRAVLAMAHGYVKGDISRMNAVLRVCYQNETLGAVAAETGIPKSTLGDLTTGFAELCDQWNQRTADTLAPAGDAA